MTFDELKRLFLGPTLFRLDTILASRLVPLLYATGLAALLLWSINHLFWRFEGGLANGVWGLIEVAAFGLLGLLVLRIACEGILVFFKAYRPETESVARARISGSLLDEVKDAIHDLAEADEATITIVEPVHTPPTPKAPAPKAAAAVAPAAPAKRGATAVRRTAKRTPKPKG